MSEGLDFADHAGRAVVITGIPFATRTDPKVCFTVSFSLHIRYHECSLQDSPLILKMRKILSSSSARFP